MPIFAASYAIAVLFSQLSHASWLLSLILRPFSIGTVFETMLSGSALALLFFPRSRHLLLLLALSMLANSLWFLPEVPNHRIVLSLLSLAVLLASCGRSEEARRGSIAAAAQALCVIVYFFAFFHKLNIEFFDRSLSCAVQFLAHIHPLFAENYVLSQFAIWGTVVFEGLVLIGLAYLPLRRLTVLIALLFHLVLSLDLDMHFVDFSSVMFCLLLCFVSMEKLEEDLSQDSFARFCRAVGVTFSLLIILGLFVVQSNERYMLFAYVRQGVWYLVAAVTILAVLRHSVPRRFETECWFRAPALGVLAIALLNGLTPYLGVKTRTAFSMYSNLRIASDESNHFLIPRSADLFGLLSDEVVLLGSDDDQGIAIGARLPYSSLVYYLERQPALRVAYRYQGREYRYPEQALPKAVPRWLRKLAFFQPYGDSIRGTCIW